MAIRTNRRIRGRNVLILDVAVLCLAFLAAVFAIPQAGIAAEALPILLIARVLGLVRAGTYQHARPLADRSELIPVTAWVALASVTGYLVEWIAGRRVDGTFVLLESFTALVAIIVLRLALAAFGVVRRARAEPEPDALPTVAPPELAEMVSALNQAPGVYRPSRFWESVNRRHVDLLRDEAGFQDFKRTVNTSYFQFGAAAFLRSLPILIASWLRHPDPRVVTAMVTERRGWRARAFAIVLALYANAVRHRPGGHLLDQIKEPRIGNPVTVLYGDRLITEDLCHSVEEYGSIMNGLPADVRVRRAMEIGAGYGRLAYVFALARPDIQYHVVDIPPALYVSQRYLTSVLPDVPAFRFRPFRRYDEVSTEMAGARVIFLEPQQLEILPDDYADLILTVSTLHEMRAEQVAHYLRLVDRLCGGVFYSKQWRRFYNDLDDVTPTEHSYPIPTRWRALFQRSALAPRSVFEALYVCRSDTRVLDG